MKNLLIVESPAKIKTIKKFLSDDFKIMSTMGHIKDLPTKEIGVSIDDTTIDINYVPIKDKSKTIADICKEASKADAIYLAPDPDREGEIIAWHAAQEIKKTISPKAVIYRIAFNEITKEAILEAVMHPGSIDEKKVAAQQARRVLDRWVGYEVSPVLWQKLARGLSAGRVQSVALRLICDREKAIREFKVEEYWSIDSLFEHSAGTIQATLAQINGKAAELNNQTQTETVEQDIKKQSYTITSIADKKRSKKPAPPFMTSTIQQVAYNRLGFSVKKTMQLAQELYEGVPLEDPQTPVALITYMRTDSLRISDTAITQVRQFIDGTYTKQYLPSSANVFEKKSKKNTQDAHEAIRPINVNITPQKVKKYVSADLAKLYELIWQRFVACQMKPAEYAQRSVTMTGGAYVFKATGSTLLFDGFLKVYGFSDDEEQEANTIIPDGLEKNDPLKLKTVTPKQHFTQPPARYTEASLVKELEKEGIGRPSTYATILNTIRERSYTTLDQKKRFLPTELGMTVTTLLVENLPHIMDFKFTAHMEEKLDQIAAGDMARDTLLRDFYQKFTKDLAHFQGDASQKTGSKRTPIPTELTCPECHNNTLAIRFGKAGEFVGCMSFPTCKFTSNFKRNEAGVIELVEAEKPVLLETTCPECHKPLRQITGRYGSFIACSGYPTCKYIPQEKASFSCPLCKKGDVIKKKWRGGSFWGCSNYPDCKFAIFDQIEETPCPQCKSPFLVKKITKGSDAVSYVCFNKECGYHKP